MNHKRRRPKHQRAGCLMCKPHKDERLAKEPRHPVVSDEKLLDKVDEPLRPKDRRHNCGGKPGLEHVPIWDRKRLWWNDWLVLRCERCGKLLGQRRKLPKVA